jgi:hypothetical protein
MYPAICHTFSEFGLDRIKNVSLAPKASDAVSPFDQGNDGIFLSWEKFQWVVPRFRLLLSFWLSLQTCNSSVLNTFVTIATKSAVEHSLFAESQKNTSC